MSAHVRAIALMVCAATLWSIAGVVTRQLGADLREHGRFEISFWRSVFCALTVAVYLARRGGLQAVRTAGVPGLVCAAMWASMFTAFMLALTLTSTANTLLVMSVSPLITAILARIVLGTPIAGRTWAAIAAAMIGMIWMFAGDAAITAGTRTLAGVLIAFVVPVAAAVNLITLKKAHTQVDLIPSVFAGGVIAALVALPLALPFRATGADVAWLALLGVMQLGVPCAMMVVAARSLSATELALLGLLEVVLGPLWAWLGAGEVPSRATLAGGGLILAALVFNELTTRRPKATMLR